MWSISFQVCRLPFGYKRRNWVTTTDPRLQNLECSYSPLGTTADCIHKCVLFQNPQVCKSGLGDFALNQVRLKKLQLPHASGLSFWFAEASVFCVTAFPWRQSLGISACFLIFTALPCEFLPKSLLTFPCRYITMKIPIR